MKAVKFFKQLVSDIITLKYKWLTLFLGTFVPFFQCHVIAYAANAKYKKKGTYRSFFILLSSILTVFYAWVTYFFICVILADSTEPLLMKKIEIGIDLFILIAGQLLITNLGYLLFLQSKEKE